VTLVAVGVSHHLAPVAVRERVHLDGTTVRATLPSLVRHAGLGGAVCLSTCNRTEFYVSTDDPARAAQTIDRFRRYLVPGPLGQRYVHAAVGAEAVGHVFRVASGLDSMVLGEGQILAQLKRAHRLAHESQTLDAALDLVMRRAVTVAKRVRTETGIGRRAVGIAQAAADEAGRRRELRGARVLVVGAGQIGAGAARLLRRGGAGPFLVAERGPRSRALAAGLAGSICHPTEVGGSWPTVDIVVCATSQAAPVLTAAAVTGLQEAPGRPLLLLDLALPRDVDPAVRGLPGVDLVDLDDLGRAIRTNLAARCDEVPAATHLITVAVRDTLTELDARRAAPAIRHLLERTDGVREAELTRTLGRLGPVSSREREQLDRLTRALTAKLLHAPIRYLRAHAGDPAGTASALEVLGLDGSAPG